MGTRHILGARSTSPGCATQLPPPQRQGAPLSVCSTPRAPARSPSPQGYEPLSLSRVALHSFIIRTGRRCDRLPSWRRPSRLHPMDVETCPLVLPFAWHSRTEFLDTHVRSPRSGTPCGHAQNMGPRNWLPLPPLTATPPCPQLPSAQRRPTRSDRITHSQQGGTWQHQDIQKGMDATIVLRLYAT